MARNTRMILTPHDPLFDRRFGNLGPAVERNVVHGFVAGRLDAGV